MPPLARASSSDRIATASESLPAPPNSSGVTRPSSPAAPMRFIRARGKVLVASASGTSRRISRSTNALQVARKARCSSLSSQLIAGSRYSTDQSVESTLLCVTTTTRADAQRARVLTVSAEIFSRQGFRATSMNEIAAAVGLSKPTLYHYFRSKEELLVRIYSEVLDESLEDARRVVAEA